MAEAVRGDDNIRVMANGTHRVRHNGVFRTLEEVMDFYDVGGGSGIGAMLPHQTLPPDSLHLDPAEKRAIIAFLGSH